MPFTDDKIADLRVKHLEMIEAAIGRMAGYSAATKGYCLTLTSAVFGLAIAAKAMSLLYVALFSPPLFAWLDAKYLALECGYRALYEQVRTDDWSSRPTFEMRPPNSNRDALPRSLESWSVYGFYVTLGTLIVVVQIIGGLLHVSIR